MALLLEEIVVELVAIAATLAGIACLAYLLVLCALERRELRLQTESRVREWSARRVSEPARLRPETPRGPATSTVQAQH
jgi:hypothetical protein